MYRVPRRRKLCSSADAGNPELHAQATGGEAHASQEQGQGHGMNYDDDNIGARLSHVETSSKYCPRSTVHCEERFASDMSHDVHILQDMRMNTIGVAEITKVQFRRVHVRRRRSFSTPSVETCRNGHVRASPSNMEQRTGNERTDQGLARYLRLNFER